MIFAEKTGQKGTVLLLALVVMSSVVLSSMGLGSLIVSSLQQSRIMDSAIIAYYAAETGAEEALYMARRQSVMPTSVVTAKTLGNAATWKRTVTGTEDVLYIGGLADNSFTEVTLFDPDTQASSGVDHVNITWADKCSGCTILGASIVGWQPGTVWDPLSAASVDFTATRHPGGSASVTVPAPTKLNRLRLRAIGGDLDDVRIRGYDGANVLKPLPGRIKIDSRGTFVGVEQKLLISLPRNAPLSGAFDFVVFSECSIVKGGTISCP